MNECELPKSPLARYPNEKIDFSAYEALRTAGFKQHIWIDRWNSHRENLAAIGEISGYPASLDTSVTKPPCALQIREGVASVEGDGGEIQEQLQQAIKDILPWRKGPLSLLGNYIDSEWRSDWKWDRIEHAIPSVTGKRVADIGCNNGYYLFRLLNQNPELLLGWDPNGIFYYQFMLMQQFLRSPALHYDPLGVEHISLIEDFFDVVFFMGVTYHRRDPLSTLELLYRSLRSGGSIIVESIVVGDKEHTCLCPADRYAKMRNVWFVPSEATLETWMKKAGFKEVTRISSAEVTLEEQRRTKDAPFESLADFLDPKDPTKTIEGYPAPRRAAFIG